MRSRKTSLVPAYNDMMWPTLQALRELGDSGSNQEIDAKTSEIMALSEEQLADLHVDGPQTKFRYRMAWARTYLKSSGALENRGRSVWAITDFGKTLSQADMKDLVNQVRARFTKKQASESIDVVSPEELPLDPTGASKLAESALVGFTDPAPEEWQDTLLRTIQEMSPASFEKLCQRVLRESGFTKVEVTGRTGDGGIDGVGVLRIALLSFQVFFQCKRYKGTVGASAIRDFRGAMVGRTDKGLFITTGSFTADAKREATRDGAPVLDLIDGEDLGTLLKSLNLGVVTRQVEQITVDVDWFRGI